MYTYYTLILARRGKWPFIVSGKISFGDPVWDGEVLDCKGNTMEAVYDFMKKEIRFEIDEDTKQAIRDGGWVETEKPATYIPIDV